MTFARRASIAVALLGVLLAAPSPISADAVTPFGNKVWANGATAKFGFDSGVTTTTKTIIRDVLLSDWTDTSTNNSNGPNYLESTPLAVIIFEMTAAQAPGFCGADFLGCTTVNPSPHEVYIRKDPANGYGGNDWCHVNNIPACIDEGRVAIHEVGHLSGYLNHYATASYARTRMTVSPPKKSQSSTYNSRTLGRCDEATMQMKYGVFQQIGVYPDCFDEVANTNTDGSLKTDLSATPSVTAACSGDQVTAGGRLNIHNYASYEAIGGNNLPAGGAGYPSRLVKLYRGTTLIGTVATHTANQGANNWSIFFSESVGTTVTYTYHAEFPSSEAAIGDKVSANFTIEWVRPIEC